MLPSAHGGAHVRALLSVWAGFVSEWARPGGGAAALPGSQSTWLSSKKSRVVTCSVKAPPLTNICQHSGTLLVCFSYSLTRCELTEEIFREVGSLLKSGTSQLKSLSIGLNNVGDKGVKHLWDAVAHPKCLLEELEWVDSETKSPQTTFTPQHCSFHSPPLCLPLFNGSVEMNGLTDACVDDLCAAVRASQTLKSLVLSNNMLTDASVPALVQVMKDNTNMEEMK